MPLTSEYAFKQVGNWNLLVLSEHWNESLWTRVLDSLRQQRPTTHPQIKRFVYPEGQDGNEFYLKVYYSCSLMEKIRDVFRDSKAFRALKQGEALKRENFRVPLVVAAGEERKLRVLHRAFLLTRGISGSPLSVFARDHFASPLDSTSLRKKRHYLRQLATEVRRLHRCGFVHGDLTPYNILVQSDGDHVCFFFLDNDRTRRYLLGVPQMLWRRNLIQLNRFVLPGISLQDRMRFLRIYLGTGTWERRDRHLIAWLEEHTRRRRAEKNGFRAQVSFRELMRWNGPFSQGSN